jgi:hypothetical protein
MTKYRFRWPTLKGGIFDFFSNDDTTEEAPLYEDSYDMSGLVLRVYSSKRNPYVGKHFPRVGACIKKIRVEDNPNWYVFQLREPMPYGHYHPSLFIIKPYDPRTALDQDKIHIYFMFVPDEKLLQQVNIRIRDLRTAGKIFSRPINL